MCRLYGFIANEPTKVDCSLVFAQNSLMQQSRVDHVGRDHTDGWGIVAYRDGLPAIRKRITAAYGDLLFSQVAESVYSTAILAHVRKATVGSNSVNNTHPFVFDEWTFAHNGTLTGFDLVRQQLEKETDHHFQVDRKGQTDSEQYFLWLLSQLQAADMYNAAAGVVAVTTALDTAVRRLDMLCRTANPQKTPKLNFALTNGRVLYACRWNNSLYKLERHGIYECEICGIPHIHHLETVDHRAVMVASEPVTHDPWVEVENQTVSGFNVLNRSSLV